MNDREIAFMRRALDLAGQARGRTAPNPMVGAVIVTDGAIVAEGWHHGVGLPHAEVDALQKLGGRAPGATMVVTLEPCCHHGRTPPCTDALLAGGVRRVVVAMVDPDPRVAGKGIDILRQAGIDVEVGLLQDESEALNQGYLLAKREGRPAVTLKAAITLDGRIASAFGESRWITSEASRAIAHRLRDTHDAILVGRGTALEDDPALTTRIAGGRDALPVVLDSELALRPEAKMLHGSRRAVVYCAHDAATRTFDADVVRVDRAEWGLDLGAVLQDLVSRNVHSVLVEGGAMVARSFLDEGLVDRVELFLAPKVLAGGPTWIAGEPFHLEAAPAFELVSAARVGPDVHLVLERP